jgi:ADP-sugar diphosphatase
MATPSAEVLALVGEAPPEGQPPSAETVIETMEKEFFVEMNAIKGGRTQVPVTTDLIDVDLQKVLDAPVFKDWVEQVDKDPILFIASVDVQSVDMFGPRIGFIKFKTAALVNVGGDEGIAQVPGIVFMRGGAVGILVILESEDREYTILTYQARVPVGIHNLPEVPAGMLDGSGNFKGVAADEIAEECDIVISEDELIDLTELAYEGKWKGMFPSAGGCDEFLRLYMCRRKVEPDVLTELEGRLTGLREEGERIKLHIVPLEDCWKLSPDAKLLACLALYDRLKAVGKLAEPTFDAAPSSIHELQRVDPHMFNSRDSISEDAEVGGITDSQGRRVKLGGLPGGAMVDSGDSSGSKSSSASSLMRSRSSVSPSDATDASRASVSSTRRRGRLDKNVSSGKEQKVLIKKMATEKMDLQLQLNEAKDRYVRNTRTRTDIYFCCCCEDTLGTKLRKTFLGWSTSFCCAG